MRAFLGFFFGASAPTKWRAIPLKANLHGDVLSGEIPRSPSEAISTHRAMISPSEDPLESKTENEFKSHHRELAWSKKSTGPASLGSNTFMGRLLVVSYCSWSIRFGSSCSCRSCRYSGLGGLCSCRSITFASLRKIQWKTYQVSFEGDLKVGPHPENSTLQKKTRKQSSSEFIEWS